MTLFEILSFFLTPLVAILEPHVQQLTQWLTSSALHRKIIKFFVGLAVLLLLVGVALVAYLSFYWVYIPQRGHVGHVYLHYQDPTVSGIIAKGPSTKVDFTRGGRRTQFLRADQAYNVAVNLHVPTSEKNVAIGNFMVHVTLQQADGTTVQTSSRPAILTYQSLPLRLMRTAWKAVPLVLDWSREEQILRVPLIERFVEDAANPVARAIVSISTPELQVYRSTIHFDAHFHGLRYFMYYYKVSTAIVFMLVFIFWEIVFTVITWQVLAGWFGPDAETLASAHRIGQADAQATLPGQHTHLLQHQLRAPTTYAESPVGTTTSRAQHTSSTLLPRQPQLQKQGQKYGGDEWDSELEEEHDLLDDDDDDEDDEANLDQGLVEQRTPRGRAPSSSDDEGDDDSVVPERPLTPSQRRYAGGAARATASPSVTGSRTVRDPGGRTTTTTTTTITRSSSQPHVSRQTVVETDDGTSTSGSTTTTASSRRTERSGLDIAMTSPPPPPPSLLSERSTETQPSQGGAGVGIGDGSSTGRARDRRVVVLSDSNDEPTLSSSSRTYA
ncbi:MAG: putative adipose-regulatory protein-domain-containing protein [Benniella sp.]|nr:MAG: putative adipose-regulatory protein-domain-containing protein [Benniella sp.]